MNQSEREALLDVTRAVMHTLDQWELDTAQTREILGLQGKFGARDFKRFREGQSMLPQDQVVLRRANYLLRIADAIRTAYPMNPRMVGSWIHQRQRRFNRRTPLTMILEGGEEGLSAVLAEIDCTFSWDCTGSKPVTHSS